MKTGLQQLLNSNHLIWRGGRKRACSGSGLATGYDALDAVLPEGGWLPGSLIEVIAPRWGIGELRLFLPAMAAAARAGKELVWIAPPHIPYPPALVSHGISLNHLLLLQPPDPEDIPWAMETVLRQRRCAIALAWSGRLKPKTVRRLQLAAEEGGSLGVLFQPRGQNSSFAATRLLLTPSAAGAQVTLLKSRGTHGLQSVDITFD